MSLAPSSRAPSATPVPGAAPIAWPSRHLLQLRGLPADHLRSVLHLARRYDEIVGPRPLAGGFSPSRVLSPGSAELQRELHGRVIANLFFEDSTRTRVSFSVAARRLGADVIDLTSVGSSMNKGETVVDTALNIAAMGVDGVVIRHRSSGAAEMVRRALDGEPAHGARGDADEPAPPAEPPAQACSVINAGDGRHEHPTQGLLDIYTVAAAFGRLETFDLSGLTVAIIGDIGSSRVARSDIAGMVALGARVICIGPPGLVPAAMATLGCEVSHDLDRVLPELDVVNVLRIQFERHDSGGGVSGGGGVPGPASSGAAAPAKSPIIASTREYSEMYGLSSRRAARLRKHAIIMHPGPINRGVELASDVADSQRSMVLRQVSYGVVVRMAVLKLCLG